MSDPVERMIAALKRERQGYVVRNLPERVRQVDEQLASLGVVEKPARVRKAVQEG